jgi:riboflavin synthase
VFTGIVEASPPLRAATPQGSGMRLRIPIPAASWTVAPGESIAVAGCCLTVAGCADPASGRPVAPGTPGADLVFDLSSETLERTWFGELRPGVRLNLERSLRLGDRLGGHLVSGHVDGQGRIAAIDDAGDGGRSFTFELDPGLERYVIDKGSITLDGISLTVVEPRGRRFRVAVIPATLEATNLGSARVGQPVNVEVDLVGKWIEKLLPAGR